MKYISFHGIVFFFCWLPFFLLFYHYFYFTSENSIIEEQKRIVELIHIKAEDIKFYWLFFHNFMYFIDFYDNVDCWGWCFTGFIKIIYFFILSKKFLNTSTTGCWLLNISLNQKSKISMALGKINCFLVFINFQPILFLITKIFTIS